MWRSVAIALAFVALPSFADDTHGGRAGSVEGGGATEASDEAVVPSSSGTLVLPRNRGPKEPAEPPEKKGPPKKTAPPAQNKVEPLTPLFVLYTGPETPGAPPSTEAVELQKIVADMIRRRHPEAVVVEPPELKLGFLDTMVIAPPSRRFTSATVVFQGLGSFERKQFRMLTRDGSVTSDEIGAAMSKLATRLGLLPPPGEDLSSQRRALAHTVLLTSYAGAVDCAAFKGTVFGLTSAGQKRNPALLAKWLNWEQEQKMEPFPITARDWFNAFKLSMGARASYHAYWYCPAPNHAGFVGTKYMDGLRAGGRLLESPGSDD